MDNLRHMQLEEAARRYARAAAPDYTPEQQADLGAWRENSAAQAQAYAAVARVADDVDRLLAQDRRLRELANEAYGVGRAATEMRPQRWAAGIGIAASLLVVLVGVRFAAPLPVQPVGTLAYTNASGQKRSYTLEDGSRAELDVGTRIEVSMGPRQRRIELLSGRALFKVTHDRARPFSVLAGGAVTTALGTQFQVSRADGGVEVTLAEGSVVVANAADDHGWQERLHPGDQLEVPTNPALRTRRIVDPLVVTSWSRGRLEFRSTPLSDAVEEVNRYATKKLRLGDPSLAALIVSGNVVAGNGNLAASAFAALLPVHLVDAGTEVILLPAHAAASR